MRVRVRVCVCARMASGWMYTYTRVCAQEEANPELPSLQTCQKDLMSRLPSVITDPFESVVISSSSSPASSSSTVAPMMTMEKARRIRNTFLAKVRSVQVCSCVNRWPKSKRFDARFLNQIGSTRPKLKRKNKSAKSPNWNSSQKGTFNPLFTDISQGHV